MYFMGLDLGQVSDYSAAVVLDRQQQGSEPATYSVVLAHRWDLGTPYPRIVGGLQHHLSRPEMAGHRLCVDYTGVGRPCVDMLLQAGLPCTPVSIHGGVHESHHIGNWSVPKRSLVATVQVLLQSGRLTFARGLPLLTVLQAELVNFRQKIDPQTAHDSYSAWRERDHDDLVLALALAAWLGERLGSQAPKVDLSRAFIRTPPFSGSGPTRSARPRPWSQRVYGKGENPTTAPEGWDSDKEAVGRGDIPTPDRSPYID